jgi:putative ABC transport system permease protein
MFKNYSRIVLRNTRRHPLHTILNLSCLTVGVAGALLIILYIDFELNYDSIHSNADRVFRITTTTIKTHERDIVAGWQNTPAPLGPTLKQEYPGVEAYTRLYQFWVSENIQLVDGDKAFQESEIYVADSTIFDIFSYDLSSGSQRSALQGPNKIILSQSLAKRMFGDDEPVGKIIKTNLTHEIPNTNSEYSLLVTGVFKDLPKNVHLLSEAIISAETDPHLHKYYYNRFNVFTYLLLLPQTDPRIIEANLTDIYHKYVDVSVDPVLVSANHELRPLKTIHLDSTGGLTYVYIFEAIALLILLIAGISYVNLTTAQATRRAVEIGLRKMMGCNRVELTYQFLTESVFMTLLSSGVAVVSIIILLPTINTALNLSLTLEQLWQPQVVLGIIGIIVCLGILGGSYPALFLSAFEPLNAMKAKVTKKAPLRKILVSVQLSVVIFVLIGTGLIYEQLQYVRNKYLGFDKQHVIRLTLPFTPERTKSGALQNTLMENQNIVSVGASSFTPGANDMGKRPVAIDGSEDQDQKFVRFGGIDFDFFKTMGISFSSGRNFSPEFPGDSSAVIVNESLVKEFNLKEPIGDKVRQGGKGNPNFFTIVGVAKDFHQSSLYNPIEPQMFLYRPSNHLFIKVQGDVQIALEQVQKVWRQNFPDDSFSYIFLDDQLDDGYKGDRIRARVFLTLSILTVFIAFLGLFGLASYLATQRIKEIGVRKVLGASVRDLVVLITKDFIILALVAAIPAFFFAWYMINQWLETFAFKTEVNYLIFAVALTFTVLLTFVTTGIQALKTARNNPLKNLGSDQ